MLAVCVNSSTWSLGTLLVQRQGTIIYFFYFITVNCKISLTNHRLSLMMQLLLPHSFLRKHSGNPLLPYKAQIVQSSIHRLPVPSSLLSCLPMYNTLPLIALSIFLWEKEIFFYFSFQLWYRKGSDIQIHEEITLAFCTFPFFHLQNAEIPGLLCLI